MGDHEAGEKFEMVWCGKEKAIGEYKVKACAVDECFVCRKTKGRGGWIERKHFWFNHKKDDN